MQVEFKSLARERSGIEPPNVCHEDDCTEVTVFVPGGKLRHQPLQAPNRRLFGRKVEQRGTRPRQPVIDRRGSTNPCGESSSTLNGFSQSTPRQRRAVLAGSLAAGSARPGGSGRLIPSKGRSAGYGNCQGRVSITSAERAAGPRGSRS